MVEILAEMGARGIVGARVVNVYICIRYGDFCFCCFVHHTDDS